MNWSERKNQINIKKHGISFSEAEEVFNDPNAIEFYDKEHSSAEEDRYVVIGSIGLFVVIVVIYTDKNNVERIISARPAEPEEETQYYEHIRRTIGTN